MTTATSAPPVTRAAVTWRDLLWLTWRQHRLSIAVMAGFAAVLAAVALAMAAIVRSSGSADHELPDGSGFVGTTQMLTLTPMLVGAVVAVFWAAPLVSREFEQRTHLVVWSQDVSPSRWLVGKVGLLLVPALLIGCLYPLAVRALVLAVMAVQGEFQLFNLFRDELFELSPATQAGYVVFGFGLGLAASVLTRRTVVSMGVTIGLYLVTRVLVANSWRPYFVPPLRRLVQFRPYSDPGSFPPDIPDNSYLVKAGVADAAGNELPTPEVCNGNSGGSYLDCVRDQGVVNRFVDFQPPSRLVGFQLFEGAVFLVLGLVLLYVAYSRVRRLHRL
ncbi:hypothetical protein [Actinosynnema sp. NPDC020468]|uniref:ABC transporter permease n=1 Tax=Actinosynnema sp. NPDC020468 TaxID=3154488 RepID=UPI0033D3E5B5